MSQTNVNDIPMSSLEAIEGTSGELSPRGLSGSVSQQTHSIIVHNDGFLTKVIEVLKSKKKYWITIGKFYFPL